MSNPPSSPSADALDAAKERLTRVVQGDALRDVYPRGTQPSDFHADISALLAALSTPGSDGERLPRATVQAIVNATYRACSNAEFGEGNMGDWDVDLRAIVNRFSTPGDANA